MIAKPDVDFICKDRQDFWENLHNYYKTNTSQATYRREYIANIMYDNNIKSVLELGCNSGGNLLFISRKCANINITGLDISKDAIEYGKEIEKNPANMIVGSLYDLGQFKDNSFDMVFTCTVLTHVPSEKVEGVIREMIRISRNFVMNIEDHKSINKPYWYKGKIPANGIPHRWETNYVDIYQKIGYNVNNQDTANLMIRVDGGANNIIWLSKLGNNLILRKEK